MTITREEFEELQQGDVLFNEIDEIDAICIMQ